MSDPFALFDIAPTFEVCLADLDRRYALLQKLCHPDRHHGHKDFGLFTEKSMAITRAYQLLKNPLTRALFLLEKESISPTTHDAEILLEMMSYQEEKEKGSLSAQEIETLYQKNLEELTRAFKEKQLQEARRLCYRLQFLTKLRSDTHAFARS